MKHTRPIVLAAWQRAIVDRFPAPFIRALFGRACDLLGVDDRTNNAWNLSVARRPSVRLLDQFVGPKH